MLVNYIAESIKKKKSDNVSKLYSWICIKIIWQCKLIILLNLYKKKKNLTMLVNYIAESIKKYNLKMLDNYIAESV